MNKNLSLKEHLFLFDIDGTILDSKGAGKQAFIQSFKKALGIIIDHDINFLGGIDNVIFKELYLSKNLPEEKLDEGWELFQHEYIKIISSNSKDEGWQIFDNVDKIIELLYEISNIALVTGNIKEGAIVKLNKVKLDHFFQCGGFGDHVLTREELVQEAICSSEKYFNKEFNKKNIYLFGDTEKDVNSAINNNIIPILIDPKKRYINEYKKWNVEYHNDFSKILSFIKHI